MNGRPSEAVPGRKDSSGVALVRIVEINEEIKTIVATAKRIHLMAMNSIFLAKKAGQAALGFGVLSHELRSFATNLGESMKGLQSMTFDTVRLITEVVKRARLDRVVERMKFDGGVASRAWSARTQADAQARHRAECESNLRRLTHQLQQRLEDTERLVELGAVLARSAKIEAAYAGPFSDSLTQVATDFESTIAAIMGSLQSLRKQNLLENL